MGLYPGRRKSRISNLEMNRGISDKSRSFEHYEPPGRGFERLLYLAILNTTEQSKRDPMAKNRCVLAIIKSMILIV